MNDLAEGTTVLGRNCGRCSLCCKLLRVDPLEKPEGQWCKHCKPGTGCQIYADRPELCATFMCAWLSAADLGDHWEPLKSKMVMFADGNDNCIGIHVEPSTPNRWRDEPYYSDIKRIAMSAADHQGRVCIYIKHRAIVVLPNKEVDLGVVEAGDHIMVGELNVPFGRDWDAFVRKAADIPEDERDKWIVMSGRRASELDPKR